MILAFWKGPFPLNFNMDPAAAPRRWFQAPPTHRRRRLATVLMLKTSLPPVARPSWTTQDVLFITMSPSCRQRILDLESVPRLSPRCCRKNGAILYLVESCRMLLLAISRGTPATRRRSAVGRNFVPAEDIIDVTGDDDVLDDLPLGMPAAAYHDQFFPQYVDASHVLTDYADVDFSSDALMGRAFSPIAYADLTVGNVVNSFGLRNNTDPLSLANLLDPVAQYIIVNKAEDGSTDAVRGYTSCPAVAHFHPKFLTFVPIPGGVRQSVVLLSETPIRTRGYPPALNEVAKTYHVTLTGPSPHPQQLLATTAPSTLVYRSMESQQRKEETMMEKLNALLVLFRGDVAAVAEFVGPSRDIGHDSVLATIYGRLSVAQRACPWAQPENLPLFLQLMFGESYLIVKKTGINLVGQHFLPGPKPNHAHQFSAVPQFDLCIQAFSDGLTAAFCYKGSPLYKLDPHVFYKITTGISNQLRNTTRQNEYLVGIPINCVVQAFNAALERFGKYVRTKSNATIPFAEFEAGMAATLDIRPQQVVLDAQSAINAPDLFIQKQVVTFDGSIPSPTFNGGFSSTPRLTARSSTPSTPRVFSQLQQHRPPRKLQRTSQSSSAARPSGPSAGTTSSHPPLHRPAHSVSPATPTYNTPNRAGTAPLNYICVHDFVAKLDAAQFPRGCTIPGCKRRHVPLPPPGQFAAADKAEILASIGQMKGTHTAAMTALVQSRN